MFVFDNNVFTSLSGAVSIGATSITVTKATSPFRSPPLPSGGIGILTLVDNIALPSKIEVITYTGRTDNGATFTLTGVTKGQEGTADQAWSNGDKVIQAVTSGAATSFKDRANHTGSQAISTVTGLQTALDAKANATGTYASLRAQATTKDDVGLDSVDNVSAASLRDRATHTGAQAISTVTGLQTALDSKANAIGTYANLRAQATTKADVGLSNADNTSDLNKPVSTATQTALNGKANTSGTYAGLRAQATTKDDVGLGSVDNVSAASLRDRTTHTGSQAISTITGLQTALDSKSTFVLASGLRAFSGLNFWSTGAYTWNGDGNSVTTVNELSYIQPAITAGATHAKLKQVFVDIAFFNDPTAAVQDYISSVTTFLVVVQAYYEGAWQDLAVAWRPRNMANATATTPLPVGASTGMSRVYPLIRNTNGRWGQLYPMRVQIPLTNGLQFRMALYSVSTTATIFRYKSPTNGSTWVNMAPGTNPQDFNHLYGKPVAMHGTGENLYTVGYEYRFSRPYAHINGENVDGTNGVLPDYLEYMGVTAVSQTTASTGKIGCSARYFVEYDLVKDIA